jgi:hypothetical protein
MAKTPRKILDKTQTRHSASNPGTRKMQLHVSPYKIHDLLKNFKIICAHEQKYYIKHTSESGNTLHSSSVQTHYHKIVIKLQTITLFSVKC